MKSCKKSETEGAIKTLLWEYKKYYFLILKTLTSFPKVDAVLHKLVVHMGNVAIITLTVNKWAAPFLC